MEQDIIHILQDAIQAPSGENCQPWSFKIRGTIIELFNLPDRDQSLYNRGQCGSYIAHGALLKNLKISAMQFGYETNIVLFPELNDKDHIANIALKKNNIQKQVLYESIGKRVTNRKPYRNEALPSDQVLELQKSIEDGEVKILFTQKDFDKKVLAKIGGLNESIMMNNKFLHNFFFSHVTWTKEEDMEKKVGFFIDTLELPPPARKMFKMLKNWRITKFLNKIGLYKMVGKQNSETYALSSGFGIFVIKDTSPQSFIKVGMALEQVWLTATKLGLNFQPVSGLLFLAQAIKLNGVQEFSKNQINLVKEGYKSIEQVFSVNLNENIVFMFRFGYGEPPTAKSSRFNIKETVIESI